MNKILSKRPHLIRIVSMVLLGLAIVSLSSCSDTYSRFPQVEGSDSVYISLNDDNGEVVSIDGDLMQVTKGEVWNELRYSASSLLTSKINEVAYTKYLQKVEEDPTTYADDLKELAIKGIYSIDDVDYLDDMDSDAQELAIEKWADTIYTSTKDTVDTSKFSEGDYSAAYEYFYDAEAQFLYGYAKLEEEIADSDDPDNYFTDSELISFYNDNYEYTGYNPTTDANGKTPGDIEAIVIRFISSAEASQTLKAFGIKEYSGDLCFIKPESDTQSYADYSDYYDEFSFTLDSNSDKYVALGTLKDGDSAVLQLYIEMYNYIYTYRTAISNSPLVTSVDTKDRRSVTESIVSEFSATSTETAPSVQDLYDDYISVSADFSTYVQRSSDYFKDLSTSFFSYVSEDLSSALTKADDNTDNSYSTSSTTQGSYDYMVYKIDQVANPDLAPTGVTEDPDNLYFINPADESDINNLDIKAVIVEEKKESLVTSSYISSAIATDIEDADISIYDTVLEISYSLDHSDYSRTRGSADSDSTLAEIELNGETVLLTTDEVYNELDASSGSSTALNLLEAKVIKTTDTYKDLTSEEDTYKTNLNDMFASFAQNSYSSYGFDSSMGKYNFMLLFFHEDNVDDIISNYFKVTAAENTLLNDYASNDDLIDDIFISYATEAYNKFFSMSATDLLVYVDRDEDGIADTDFDWSSTVIGTTTTYTELASQLIEEVSSLINHSTNTATDELATIVTEFNTSSRFEDDSTTNNPTLPESTWAVYRRAGLSLSSTDLADITNASTSTEVEPSTLEVLSTIYNSDEFNIGGSYPSEYIYSKDGVHSYSSESGYNYLIVTAATAPSSALYANEDATSLYNNIPVIFNDKIETIDNLQNDSNIPNANQIKLYLYRYITAGSSDLTPADMTTALDDFIKPIYTRYTGAESQVAHVTNYINTGDFGGTVTYSAATEANAKKISEINRKTLDSYQTEDDLGNTFVGWWSTIDTLFGGNE